MMTLEDVKSAALRLESKDRANLARELLASLDELSDTEIEALWIDEAIRRDREIEEGAARTYRAEEVIARVRAHCK